MTTIKKAVIIDTLKAGGRIKENIVYQERRLYNAAGDLVGAVRWDTLSKLYRDGLLDKISGGWSMVDSYLWAGPVEDPAPVEVEEAPEAVEAETEFLDRKAENGTNIPFSVSVVCPSTGVIMEGPARSIYRALRAEYRAARYAGETPPCWAPGCSPDSPLFGELLRLIVAAEADAEPAAPAEGIKSEFVYTVARGFNWLYDVYRFRGHWFRVYPDGTIKREV